MSRFVLFGRHASFLLLADDYQGKVVLVTGGAKGIGRMISEGFVANGATVYISSRDAKSCDEAVKELNALGKGKAHAIPADFYKEEECQRLADELKKRENSKLHDYWQYGWRLRGQIRLT